MKLIRAVSCWGNEVTPIEAVNLAREWNFEAVEGPAELLGEITSEGVELFAEIVTGCTKGTYVSGLSTTPEQHLEEFRRKLDLALPLNPKRVTTMAGSDFWSFPVACRFLEDLVEIGEKSGVVVCVETHRSRPTFHPVRTARLLAEIPHLSLTLDVSHWCAVCERLMPDEIECMAVVEKRVRHVHARVGYDQGPQVPDPRVDSYQNELQSHLACWKRIARNHENEVSFTPEFGPDGYLHRDPKTGEGVADLREINRWMGGVLKSEL